MTDKIEIFDELRDRLLALPRFRLDIIMRAVRGERGAAVRDVSVERLGRHTFAEGLDADEAPGTEPRIVTVDCYRLWLAGSDVVSLGTIDPALPAAWKADRRTAECLLLRPFAEAVVELAKKVDEHAQAGA